MKVQGRCLCEVELSGEMTTEYIPPLTSHGSDVAHLQGKCPSHSAVCVRHSNGHSKVSHNTVALLGINRRQQHSDLIDTRFLPNLDDDLDAALRSCGSIVWLLVWRPECFEATLAARTYQIVHLA